MSCKKNKKSCNVFKLPIRDGALLETLVAQEHVNTHQVVEALEQETTVYKGRG